MLEKRGTKTRKTKKKADGKKASLNFKPAPKNPEEKFNGVGNQNIPTAIMRKRMRIMKKWSGEE